MENIGMKIVGRCSASGFGTFLDINWKGGALPDEQPSKRYIGKYFYTARTGADVNEYEVVLSRLVAPDQRETLFRIAICVPADKVIVDAAGMEVSPVTVLNLLRDKAVENYLDVLRDQYFYRNDRYPVIQQTDFAPILTRFSTALRWGRTMAMTGDARTGKVFVSGDAKYIAKCMKELPYCTRLASAGKVEFGEFSADVPLFSFSDSELMGRRTVRVLGRNLNGAIVEVVPDMPETIRLHSRDFGFSPVAYANIDVELTRAGIFESPVNGVCPTPAGVTLHVNRKEGSVTVEFNPAGRREDYVVNLTGLAQNDSPSACKSMLALNFGNRSISLASGTFSLQGEDIERFSQAAAQKTFVDRFSIGGRDCDYEISGASLMGTRVNISLKKRHKAESPIKKGEKGGVPFVCDSPMASLTVKIPLKYRKQLANIDFEVIQKSDRNLMTTTFEQVIVSSDGKDYYTAKTSFPLMRGSKPTVIIGCPAEYSIQADCDGDDNYEAVASSSNRKSAWWRFLQILSFRFNDGLSNLAYFGRAGLLAFVAILLLLGGIAIGVCYHEPIVKLVTPASVEQTISQSETAQPPVPPTQPTNENVAGENPVPEAAEETGKSDNKEAGEEPANKPQSEQTAVSEKEQSQDS